MSNFDYLETTDKEGSFDKPKSTGVKMLTLVGSDDSVLDPNNEKYIEGAEAGGFVIKSDNLVVNVPMRVIVMQYAQVYAEFKDNMGDFIRYVTVEEARRLAIDPLKFGALDTKEGTVMQESFCFIVMLPDYDNILALLNFMSSRVPDGSAFLRRLNNTKHGDNIIAAWNQVYTVDTRLARNTKGAWYMIKPTFHQFVTLDEHKLVTDIRSSVDKFQMPMLEDGTKNKKEDY